MKNPSLWLVFFLCAPYDSLKLFPLFIIYSFCPHDNPGLEFLLLMGGDIAMLMVTSLKDKIPLDIGVFFFMLFVWGRLFIEKPNLEKRWPWLLFPSLALLVIYYHPIREYLLRAYAMSLSLLLAAQWHHWGYRLYVLSDCLLLVSLSIRFPGDWFLVRVTYWVSLALIFHI